jgi:hypothetical protein
MNERAERINGWAAMLGVIAAMGSYAVSGQIIPGIWYSVFSEDIDDDDDKGGGMLIPAQIPIQ